MIVEVVHPPAKSDQADALREGLQAARAVMSQADGYLDSAFHQGIENPLAFLLTIRWTNVDAHMVGFRGGPLFPAWRSLFTHTLDGAPVISHYTIFAGS
ncbi:MAG: antibiotic biosynthesis monooxygenase [Chloroflexi bacterium]|nr:antibiotic biosynthesis monooxygenase [Chloroflexota bacterium]